MPPNLPLHATDLFLLLKLLLLGFSEINYLLLATEKRLATRPLREESEKKNIKHLTLPRYTIKIHKNRNLSKFSRNILRIIEKHSILHENKKRKFNFTLNFTFRVSAFISSSFFVTLVTFYLIQHRVNFFIKKVFIFSNKFSASI